MNALDSHSVHSAYELPNQVGRFFSAKSAKRRQKICAFCLRFLLLLYFQSISQDQAPNTFSKRGKTRAGCELDHRLPKGYKRVTDVTYPGITCVETLTPARGSRIWRTSCSFFQESMATNVDLVDFPQKHSCRIATRIATP